MSTTSTVSKNESRLSPRHRGRRTLRALASAGANLSKHLDPARRHRSHSNRQIRMCIAEPEASGKRFMPLVLQPGEKLIFLAGGVQDAAQWRSTLELRLLNLSGLPSLALINPVGKASAEMSDVRKHLIKWQISHLEKSDVIVFWFHRYTFCPGTLLEFGQWAVPMAKKAKRRCKVIVGADPEYEKRGHLLVHCEGKYKLHDSLNSLAQAVAEAVLAM